MTRTRFFAGARLALAMGLAIAAAQAEAAVHRFELAIDGGPLVTFNIDSEASPSYWNEGSFEFGGLSATFSDPGSDPVEAGATLYFYTSEWSGGLDLSSSRGDEFGFLGPQLFSGTTDRPVFNAGVFQMDGGSLTISEIAPVPEPGEWAMLAAGLGLVGFVARRKGAAE